MTKETAKRIVRLSGFTVKEARLGMVSEASLKDNDKLRKACELLKYTGAPNLHYYPDEGWPLYVL